MTKIHQLTQNWFEMLDIRQRSFNNCVWIPLRANICHEKQGQYGFLNYKEDFFGAGSIAFPIKQEEQVKKLGWINIGIDHQHTGEIDNDAYIPADIYTHYEGFEGVHLVLNQVLTGDEPSIWHLNQDLVLTLALKQEGNSWVCPQDGYVEVARLKVDDKNKPVLLEIKAEYLKDYLCARGMGLYMTCFFSRDAIFDNPSKITWDSGNNQAQTESYEWEGKIIPIHEGGYPYGQKLNIFHLSRTDVEEDEDVPDISSIPSEDNTKSEVRERNFQGKKLYRILGRLWRNEWIKPGKHSPKVRGDKLTSTVFFLIDAEGFKVCGDDLIYSGKWLWFKPDVIMALCNRRGGSLSFYTRDTGCISCSPDYKIHFGVNDLGYVNVYAKDIGLLPEWQQQIWAGYNVTPEGGVSQELLASQVKAEPANTQAPEEFLLKGIELINQLSQDKIGIKLFSEHAIIPELLSKVHRFRSLDASSFYSLAKDLARLTADSLDTKAMNSIVSPPQKEKWGSLKSLENLLASKFDRERVKEATASLVGVYQLRHADAHLPSSQMDESFKLVGVDRSQPFINQGYTLLCNVVSSLFDIAEVLNQWK